MRKDGSTKDLCVLVWVGGIRPGCVVYNPILGGRGWEWVGEKKRFWLFKRVHMIILSNGRVC